MFRLDSGLLPCFEEVFQTLVLETLDHGQIVTRYVTLRNLFRA
jgi:hypothetical protein